ncbi:MAG: glycosyltransferase family 39 protein [Planctomycetes bacterium]|nr:glycosyltransferase family 39 protein [Planctomycetota bacterium]
MKRPGAALSALMAAAVLLLVVPAGIPTLWDKHEGRFMEAARGMLATGDWVVPKNVGEPLVFYPPMCAWTIAVCAKVLGGLSEFTARLPGALAAVGCVWLAFKIGELLFDRRTGLFAGAALLTIPVWPKIAIMCQPDTPVVFLLMASLYALLRLERAEKHRWPWAVLFWAAIAVSALSKGPPGPVMTLAVAGTYALWERKWRLAWTLNPLLGIVIVAAIVPPWFLLARHVDNGEFLRKMWHEVFDMAAGGEMLMHAHPSPFWYLPKIAASAPWLLFALAAAIPASADPRERSARRFLISWVGIIVLMLSIAKAKRPYYLLPIWPAIAILAATWWTRLASWGSVASQWRERLPVTLIGLAAIAVLVVPFVVPQARLVKEDLSRPILFAAAVFASAAAMLFFALHVSGRRTAGFVAMAGALFIALGFQQTWGAYHIDTDGRRGAAFCASVRGKIGPDTKLLVHHVESFVPFYLATPYDVAFTPEAAAADAKDGTMLLTEKLSWETRPELRAAWEPFKEAGTEMSNMVLCRPRRK